ncbi:hypothetical protein MANES_06G109550v8 [Manihot esculenta]|uniref:Uncharacterized protein n=1 Tax=Manihot esculenta TaxID=3983 RepID=A0ACB7HJZ3_MANES|nr:hypothetical protein MANES_06G109550v8 [Manihot esculenta]
MPFVEIQSITFTHKGVEIQRFSLTMGYLFCAVWLSGPIGQLSIIFLWLSGMYLHGARFSNYESCTIMQGCFPYDRW